VLRDELWLEAAFMVARDFNRQFTKLSLQRLAVFTVVGIAYSVGNGLMLVMTKVLLHFCLQGTFNQGFGELFEKTLLANQVFWLFII